MSLAVGSRLGSHEILGLLGAGGMGEVFLAHDTRLKRRVAIKILPPSVAGDPDRRARFQREAQALAALNHPNIAGIYDVDESGGTVFLVLELVEGETLAERLGRGPVPLAEAKAIALQILAALEAAHAKGICHRDLKPANIKVTRDGAVKVLDFGIAKFLERSRDGSEEEETTVVPTASGLIVGTPGYLSPEQAKGQDVDERSDIFSFGCILYELLSGSRAFKGDTSSDMLASILKSDVDFSRLPAAVDPRLRAIVSRCLEKLPRQRWHAAADVRIQLEALESEPALESTRASRSPILKWAVGTAAALVAGLTAGYAAWTLKPAPAPVTTRFFLTLPDGQQFSHVGRPVLAVSRDGTNLVYVANRRLYLRPMAGFESHVIPGSELADGVQSPVFSPDGQWIAFRSVGDSTIKRLPVTGGAPVTVGPNPTPFGLSWDEQGLLFGELGKGILRVAPEGGSPEVIVQVSADEMADSPQLLPGGYVLFSVKKLTEDWDQGQIAVQALTGGPRKILVNGGAAARYVPTGHLIYAVANVLFAVPFNIRDLTVTGGAVSIVEGVNRGLQARGARAPATAQYAISETGSLAFVPGTRGAQVDGSLDLAIFDRTSAPQRLGLPPALYDAPRASRDGKWAALERETGGERDVWIVDLTGSAAIRRLTFGGKSRAPIWSGDSAWVIVQSEQNGASGLFRQRADGSGTAERLTTAEAGALHVAQSASAEGAHLLLTIVKDGRQSLWDLTLGDRRMTAFDGVQSPALIEAAFSPDGRWVAYSIGASGAGTRGQNISEAFVQPFPATGAKYQIPSPLGATRPVWTSSGGAIHIGIGLGRDGVVPVTLLPRVEFGQLEAFTLGTRLGSAFNGRRNFDPVPDGRILGLIPMGLEQPGGVLVPQVAVVLNWFEELRAKVR